MTDDPKMRAVLLHKALRRRKGWKTSAHTRDYKIAAARKSVDDFVAWMRSQTP